MKHHVRNTALLLLGLFAVAERLWFDLGPNVELVSAAAILAAIYGGKRWSILLPLSVMAVSDLVLGNTSIALFTWSAYALAGLFALVFVSGLKTRWNKIGFSFGAGVGMSLWFFAWTNFGVWLLDSWGMYPRTWQGLWQCYLNGLPFLRNQLLGNMFIVPLITAVIEITTAALRNKTQYTGKSVFNRFRVYADR